MHNANPILSVIVPVYNERANLPGLCKAFVNSPCPVRREWIVVDDGSTDGSWEYLEEVAHGHGFQLMRHTVSRGKGAAVRTGIEAASGDLIMIQDADFEYDLHDVPNLLEPLLSGQADVVYGSRFKKDGRQVHRTYHYFINALLTFLSNLFSGIYLTDMETCYKIFRADILKAMNLRSRRFGIEVEMTAYLAKLPVRVFELPIRYYPRTRLQGKKINWRDGLAALWHLVHFNLFVDDKQAFKYQPQLGVHQAPPAFKRVAGE